MASAPARRPGCRTSPPEDVEARLRRLELTVTRRLDGLLHGEHLGLLPGPGSERPRAGSTGPATTCAGWTGRSRPGPRSRTSSDLVADRELATWAVVDLTPSMDFGTASWEKRDLALAATTAVGFLTTRLGSRFGLC